MQGGRGSGRASTGAVRLWGHHAVEAALNNPERKHRKLWATREGIAALDGELPANFPLEYAQAADLGRLVARDAPHQGLVLECDGLEDVYLGDVLDGDPARPDRSCSIRSPIRTMSARSCARLRHSVLRHWSRRTAMPRPNRGWWPNRASGALEIVPWVRVVNLARALEEIAEAGYWRIGLDGKARGDAGRGPAGRAGGAGAGQRGRRHAPQYRRSIAMRWPGCR